MAPARRGDEAGAVLGAVERLLRDGVRVADVRCDDGDPLIALARAFPRSTFHGFGPDPAAIRAARRRAAEAGVSDRVTFEVCVPSAVEAEGYDLLVDAERVSEDVSRSIR